MVQVRNHKIIVTLILVGLSYTSFGQNEAVEVSPDRYLIMTDSSGPKKVQVVTYADLRASAANYSGGGLSLPVSPVQQDLYTKNFGFFCRKELQFEKSTKIPIRVRLGSLEQCNRLEQKD